ncbi:siroheme synthase CysG [Biostraticola tofi]|uniref:Siroheme synthase n=1 Tax=Biostraticola tofi TaxID=466109 RepID=A0A4R3Z2R5_9GAMM|nr:siroheme synthase CysG [Biostraticola tofi]TCV99227.1 uroporphyrinogen-III C-methyltransferase /precorrin-2 dehydrogenase [Biostraticola tofi]
MEYLPLFADLRQRPVLVVGGGEVAARKIVLLQRAGAAVRIVARELAPELKLQHQAGRLSVIGEVFTADMLAGVFLVIAATDDAALNAEVSAQADKRHILANVVDDQPQCSIIFPSIVDRSPIMIAISSGGKAPVLARILREKLESLLPAFLGPMAQIAGNWRERVKQHIGSMTGRRRFWEKALNGRFASLVAQGQLEGAEDALMQQLTALPEHGGEVALVGAGPGDAGLMTLRGLQLMQQADVVLYDFLVSDEVLELVRRDAERICVGKRAGQHSMTQDEINRLLVTHAQQGRRVVRLKGGDPFIFGRGGEELQQVAEAGIPFQVVPGITAAAGATAYAGIPLTHREYAQSVLFITGHLRPDGNALDWPALAQGQQTLAIYMGVVKAAEISRQLIINGRSPQTPVAVISRGTRPDQQVFIGTLDQLETLAQHAPTPALLVIGDVVTLHHQIAWFGKQDLTSQKRASVVNLA